MTGGGPVRIPRRLIATGLAAGGAWALASTVARFRTAGNAQPVGVATPTAPRPEALPAIYDVDARRPRGDWPSGPPAVGAPGEAGYRIVAREPEGLIRGLRAACRRGEQRNNRQSHHNLHEIKPLH